jgi:hypothetical protein
MTKLSEKELNQENLGFRLNGLDADAARQLIDRAKRFFDQTGLSLKMIDFFTAQDPLSPTLPSFEE